MRLVDYFYSEDGILTGLINTHETVGIQSKGVYVYNKHFVLNDQENNRAGIGTWCNEQALREIYLRAFELPIVDADAKCVMTAFNRLGARWAGAYTELLTDWRTRSSRATTSRITSSATTSPSSRPTARPALRRTRRLRRPCANPPSACSTPCCTPAASTA